MKLIPTTRRVCYRETYHMLLAVTVCLVNRHSDRPPSFHQTHILILTLTTVSRLNKNMQFFHDFFYHRLLYSLDSIHELLDLFWGFSDFLMLASFCFCSSLITIFIHAVADCASSFERTA